MINIGNVEMIVFLCSLLPRPGEGHRVTKTMTRSAAAAPLFLRFLLLPVWEGGMGDGHNTNEKELKIRTISIFGPYKAKRFGSFDYKTYLCDSGHKNTFRVNSKRNQHPLKRSS